MTMTPISGYALIGDSRSAALVSRDGSIDWLCLPRFDSPSVFAAILDAEAGGRFWIRPTGPFDAERRYVPETNVLETTFRTAGGACVLRDLMPVSSEEEKRARLNPDHEVLREIEGIAGEIELEVDYAPRPDYARRHPRLEQRGPLGLWCQDGRAALVLLSELPLSPVHDGSGAHGVARIRAADRKYLSVIYSREAPAALPSLGHIARERVERSIRWWREWSGRATYHGPYRDAVLRSALVLKLLAYAPSGAVVAAPTTSLPERLGGTRNWDYRYCWLRDAAFTLRALFALGHEAEALAFVDWVLHATRLTWPELQVLYDVFGEARLPEQELPHLAGYANSRPVRIGNDAHGQLQLDVYGEVIDAAALFASLRGRFSRETMRMLTALGETVCERWREPDDGIWEVRSGPEQHTLSKALCWVALDFLIKMHERGQLHIPARLLHRFERNRQLLRTEIEVRGYSEHFQSYTRTLDGDDLDASLLLLPLYGYVEATEPRMRATCDAIRQKLGRGPLIYRYEARTNDGLPPGEGAFGVCSFWAVECLARAGELDVARKMYEQLLGYANDVGLFAEEIDPETGEAVGNFPQAFTHVGLVNAALTLAECSGEAIAEPRARPAEKIMEEPA